MDNSNLSRKIISDIIIHNKYAKYLPELNRRESWNEASTRVEAMHVRKFPSLEREIKTNFEFVRQKQVLPSMRMLQFGGKPVEINPARAYNCSFTAINNWKVFSEIMFLLLGGTGVGYSVQSFHVAQLPTIRKPSRSEQRFLIQDSAIGWADAVKALMQAYFFGTSNPRFDYRDIREKGRLLLTSGGRAPGPEPLANALELIRKILDSKKEDTQLTPLECHDIVCIIADAVLSGGIRRSALIALFSLDDREMISCKHGNWTEEHPYRARANNSANLLRFLIKRKAFDKLWYEDILPHGFGEPAPYFSNDAECGLNPCNEISLRKDQFCNLSTINLTACKSQEDFLQLVTAAAFIGTLQASYTDFHYLRNTWRKVTEKEALLGVSMTGIASANIDAFNFIEAAELAVKTNRETASLLDINSAARVTCIKPEGTGSLALGAVTSGIHPAWNKYVARRMQVLKTEPIYHYLEQYIPALLEDDIRRPNEQAYIVLPLEYPDNTVFRDEPVLHMLERIKKMYNEWILPGHISGNNTHNVSATVSVKPSEWDEVIDWMWKNKESYNGITALPHDGGKYKQAPFTDITKKEYNELLNYVQQLDLTQVVENYDTTTRATEIACAGGACQI